MRHLKYINEDKRDYKTFFKERIDWKLYNYILEILTHINDELRDDNLEFRLEVQIKSRTIILGNGEYVNEPDAWWGNRFKDYDKHGKGFRYIVYVDLVDRDEDTNALTHVEKIENYLSEIKKRIDRKYAVKYINCDRGLLSFIEYKSKNETSL